MQAHTPITTVAPRRVALARIAVVTAAACAAVGAAVVVGGDDRPASPIRDGVVSTDQATARYRDVELNKANSIRKLGLRASDRAKRSSGYFDFEANKARSARGH